MDKEILNSRERIIFELCPHLYVTGGNGETPSGRYLGIMGLYFYLLIILIKTVLNPVVILVVGEPH